MDQTYEKLGYLQEEFRFFHLCDKQMRTFDYHYHDFDKLLIFVSGNASYHVEGKTYPLAPLDIVYIPHGHIHCPEIDFSMPYERYIIYLSPDFYSCYAQTAEDFEQLSALLSSCTQSGDYVFHTSAQAQLHLSPLLSSLRQEMTDGSVLYEKTLLLQLLLWCSRLLSSGDIVTEQKPTFNAQILEVIHFINEHYSDDLSVDFLSETFFLSRFYLMRQFKEATGCTLHNYINQKRLLAARDAIRSGIPATTAAIEYGFKDYSTFSRAYKKLFSKAPTEL